MLSHDLKLDSTQSVESKKSFCYFWLLPKVESSLPYRLQSTKQRNFAESAPDSAPYFEKCDIVGPICESGDFLAKDIALPPTNSGDLIAILDCGAYGFSMSSNYNSRLKCAEVALKNGECFLIRGRESFAESIKNEENCLKKTKGKL